MVGDGKGGVEGKGKGEGKEEGDGKGEAEGEEGLEEGELALCERCSGTGVRYVLGSGDGVGC